MKMERKDYYQVLEIEREVTPQNIKEAYRKLAFQYHPDRNRGNPAAVEKMKELNEAYAVLSDPRKRRDYDTLRERYGPSGFDRFKQSYSEQDIFRGSDINQVFEEMGRAFGFRGFDEIFRESYGQGYRTFEFRRPGVFGRGFIYFGPGFGKGYPTRAGGLPEMVPGSLGKLTGYFLKKMLGLKEAARGKDWYDTITIDPLQTQEGEKVKYFHRRRSKDLVVAIPSGTRSGQKIRLKGMGASGQDGGESGDLYLTVRIRKPLLQRVRELFKNIG
jgi:DnaJ-class molecular chaperone